MDAVAKARKPFGLFFDIMDYKCVAIDGEPCPEVGGPIYIRLDSHGRIFIKTEDTNNLWQKVADLSVSVKDLLEAASKKPE